ncbi:MAG: DNA polymerase ligase N-terminal domain-containing protein, partial [Nanoarchaeota archaeon]
LAVHVDDHAVEYMDFEGMIPEGSYGAGTVRIWDKGTWEPESVKEKKIVAHIHGKKLSGRYTLVSFKGKNWLFFKAHEEEEKTK